MSIVLLNRTRTRILRVLLLEGPSTCHELSLKLRLSLSTTRRHLNVLTSVGLIDRVPAGRFRASPEKVRSEVEAIGIVYLGGGMPPAPLLQGNRATPGPPLTIM
ncbi:winged helix-turn-helix domain-containing protein [Arthrobacter sp. HS15c]|uniref:winged helix-turn-helix domain-containing protein n=1 Tax=Arthrobacter sp. HS15c TaxID=3230279 RepID=UPI0034664884